MPAILAACRDAKRARLVEENFQTLSEEEANEFDANAMVFTGFAAGTQR